MAPLHRRTVAASRVAEVHALTLGLGCACYMRAAEGWGAHMGGCEFASADNPSVLRILLKVKPGMGAAERAGTG
jgi:hypothetical protein